MVIVIKEYVDPQGKKLRAESIPGRLAVRSSLNTFDRIEKINYHLMRRGDPPMASSKTVHMRRKACADLSGLLATIATKIRKAGPHSHPPWPVAPPLLTLGPAPRCIALSSFHLGQHLIASISTAISHCYPLGQPSPF